MQKHSFEYFIIAFIGNLNINSDSENGSHTDSAKQLTYQTHTPRGISTPRQKVSKSGSQISIVSIQNSEKPIAVGRIDLQIDKSPKPIKELGKIVSASPERVKSQVEGKKKSEKPQDASPKPELVKEISTASSTPKCLLIDIPISTKNQLLNEIKTKNPFASFQNINKVGASKEKMSAKKR